MFQFLQYKILIYNRFFIKKKSRKLFKRENWKEFGYFIKI